MGRQTTRTRPLALLIANRGFGLANSRLPLMTALMERGFRVVACASKDATTIRIEELGVTVEHVPFVRGGFQARDVSAMLRLRQLFTAYQPGLIHHFNAKPIAYGSLASRNIRAQVVNTVTGLGHGFDMNGLNGRGTRAAYGLACPRADAVIFQNPHDRDLFVQRGWTHPARAHVVVGSGVDIRRYRGQPPRAIGGTVRILMVSRMLWGKGIREFVEAARLLRSRGLDAEFVLGGEWQDGHPDSVDRDYVEDADRAGHIRFVGYVNDMPEEFRRSSIFVYPSYYREGVPRVLLEASASARPVVTADVPGCRDVVRHGDTGLVVPPRDTNSFVDAVEFLVDNPTECDRMGRNGRSLVERQFSLAATTQRQLDVYESIGVFEDARA